MTASCFLSSNFTCVLAIFETMMRSYAMENCLEVQDVIFFCDGIAMLVVGPIALDYIENC